VQGKIEAKVVRARHFELVDDEGKPLAQLGSTQDGATALEFRQAGTRQTRLVLGVDPSGTANMDFRQPDTQRTRLFLGV
jgi:hypothetical protein